MDITYELIFFNDDHFVFRKNEKMYKLQPSNEIYLDRKLSNLVKSYPNRFGFWFKMRNPVLKRKLMQMAKIESLEDDFTLLTSKNLGIDCGNLWNVSCLCPNTSIQMTIHPNHINTFVHYLKTSVNILSRLNIAHGDIRFPNIMVSCTKEEIKTNEILTSLPVLIDFGQAQFTKRAQFLNDRAFVKLWQRCNNGIHSITKPLNFEK
jgi:serine/threonine protein kinase